MTLSVTPTTVNGGDPIAVTYSYNKDKTGGVVALYPAGQPSMFLVQLPDGSNPTVPFFLGQDLNLHGLPAQHAADQRTPSGWPPAFSSQPIQGTQGTVFLYVPMAPGTYQVQAIYTPDGGTIDNVSVGVVVGAPTPAPPPPVATNSWDVANGNPTVTDTGRVAKPASVSSGAQSQLAGLFKGKTPLIIGGLVLGFFLLRGKS